MTDEQIIKALECCTLTNGNCSQCPLNIEDSADCFKYTIQKHSLDLINRQKAEIERLIDLINEIAEANEDLVRDNHDLYVSLKKRDAEIEHFADIGKMYSEVRAEAIREFSERLHKIARKFCEYYEAGWNCTTFAVEIEDIDNLVKEMTEGQL